MTKNGRERKYKNRDADTTLIRILIAADDPVVAQATSVMMQDSDFGINSVDIALSGREAIEKAELMHPDIILIDPNIRGISGMETVRVIRNSIPDVRFIVFCAPKDYDSICLAVKLGASDYFTKSARQEEILAAVQKIASDIIEHKEALARETYMKERVEVAVRIIKKDFIRELLSETDQSRRMLSYGKFLGVSEQTGFMITILCRKIRGDQLLDSILYKLSTKFELIGSSIRPGLAVAFVSILPDHGSVRDEVLKSVDDLLMQHQDNNEDVIAGVGCTYNGVLQMKTSLMQAFCALDYISDADILQKRCCAFDPETMVLPENNGARNEQWNHSEQSTKIALENAIKYIEKNYHQSNLSLNEVASNCHLSSYYFSRIFKKYTGENFRTYLLNLRINKAKELLSENKYSVKKVAYQAGFSDPNYFSKVFHNVTGIKASDFAEKHDRTKRK